MTFEQRIDSQRYFPLLFSACLAAVLFHQFFLGRFTIAGTDLLFAHYPNLIFGYREFHEFGKFGLWNRFIFDGTDFTASMHAHYLNPLYWPLLLFPEKYIFHVMTFEFMVMNALTGWIWFRIASHFGVRGYQSLLVATVSQAGMFFWFSMTTMIAVPMYLFASFACLLIFTRGERSALANYVLLSLTFGLITVTPHPAYILGFMLPVLVVFLIDAYPEWSSKPWRGFAPVFIAAGLTALILTAYRLLPVYHAIAEQGEFLESMKWLVDYTNNAYLGLTAFSPTSFGVLIADAMEMDRKLGYPIRHTQMHNALYFGIVPLMVIYTALRTGAGQKVMFLAFVVIAAQLEYVYAFQPLSDAMQMLFYPLVHDAIFRLGSNFAFLFLLVFCLRHLATLDGPAVSKVVREGAIIAAVILIAAAGLYGRIAAHEIYAGGAQISAAAAINIFRAACTIIIVGGLLLYRLDVAAFARHRFALAGTMAAASIVILLDVAATGLGVLPGNEITMAVFENSLAVILVCLSLALTARPDIPKAWSKAALFGSVVAALMLVITLRPSGVFMHTKVVALAILLGWVVFIALVVIVLNILARWANGDIAAGKAWRLLFIVALVDLVASFGTYSYVNIYGSSPYYKRLADAYPGQMLAVRTNRYYKDIEQTKQLQNLLVNGGLSQTAGQLAGWNLGGKNMAQCPATPGVAALRDGVVHVCYPGNDGGGNLYQDVPFKKPARQIAFGAWVRAAPGMSAALLLVSPANNIGAPLVTQQGDGKWHWLSTSLSSSEALVNARAHINLPKAGSIYVFAPRLVYGAVALPDRQPDDGHQVVQPEYKYPQSMDLDSYRVNHVTLISGYAGNELMSNFAAVYGMPTYAGVDSDMTRDFVDFLANFRKPDPSWYFRAGITSSVENGRMLDLFGVGYDRAADGTVIFRPDAIPRLAAFSDFEVQADRKLALQRLKAKDFEPTHTVLLEHKPDAADVYSHPGHFQKLAYERPDADELHVRIAADKPRVILFNDRFSPGWQATWNGEPLQIQRANTLFMAVALPPGAGELVFSFHPAQFYLLVKIAVWGLAIILALGAWVLFRWVGAGRGWLQTRPASALD